MGLKQRAGDGDEGMWEKEAYLWGPTSAGKWPPQGRKGEEKQDGGLWSQQLFTPPAASGSSVFSILFFPGEGHSELKPENLPVLAGHLGKHLYQWEWRETLPVGEQPRHRISV